jgi:hypothetical protein
MSSALFTVFLPNMRTGPTRAILRAPYAL